MIHRLKYASLLLVLIVSSCENDKNKKNAEEIKINNEITWLYEWLAAWELISNDVFKLEKADPPEMLFFDDKYVYTNSRTSAPKGQEFNGPKLYGKKIIWLKQSHNDTITTPDGKEVPIQIMTFAAPSEKEGIESFFVMAAPTFWKSAGIESEEVGLKNMLTGVFLHEFAHTRQMNGIGHKISYFEKNYQFDFPVSDDIVQDYFSNDSSYVQIFKKETAAIYSLLSKPLNEINPSEIEEFLHHIKTRHETYLKPKHDDGFPFLELGKSIKFG